MARIIDTETTIECYFNPAFYVTDRRGCLSYVMKKYRDRIPDEVIDEIYAMNLWNVDDIELALIKVGKYIGKVIITKPEPRDDP
jgi:hypothetical protein